MPVMPNTAIALVSPPLGKSNFSPLTTCPQEKSSGLRINNSAAINVSIVNSATLNVAMPSMRSYPPPNSSATVSAYNRTTQATTGTPGKADAGEKQQQDHCQYVN